MRFLFSFFTFMVITLSLSAQSLTIMSYNIRYDNPDDGENNWHQRKADLAHLIQFYSPDFIGIQEALHHQLTYLDSALVDYTYIGVGRDDGKTKGEYSAIFYKKSINIVDDGTFWLSETPAKISKGWDAVLPRICTWGDFELANGKKISVYNAHYDHIGEEARVKSSELIMQKMKENAGSTPLILMGDLNSEPTTPQIQRIKAWMTSVYDPQNEMKNYGPIGTFEGFKADYIPEKEIDFIFVKNCTVERAAHLDDRRPDFNNYVSDHLPVWCQIIIPE